MNKIVAFIFILFACGTIFFLYNNKENISLPALETLNEQEKPIPDNQVTPPPSIKSASTPKTNIQKPDIPEAPNFSEKHSPSTTPEKKSIDIKKKTELDPVEELDSVENEDESINSYPIEDAEIYFVPPDQRYPGNLGGPPQLDIPDSSR